MGRPPGKHCGDGLNRTPKSRHLQNTGDPTKNTGEAISSGRGLHSSASPPVPQLPGSRCRPPCGGACMDSDGRTGAYTHNPTCTYFKRNQATNNPNVSFLERPINFLIFSHYQNEIEAKLFNSSVHFAQLT